MAKGEKTILTSQKVGHIQRLKRLFPFNNGKYEIIIDDSVKQSDRNFLDEMCVEGLVGNWVSSFGMEETYYAITEYGKRALQ